MRPQDTETHTHNNTNNNNNISFDNSLRSRALSRNN